MISLESTDKVGAQYLFQRGKVFEVTNSRPIVVEAMGGGFQSRNGERLQIQVCQVGGQDASYHLPKKSLHLVHLTTIIAFQHALLTADS
jgi:hypothetical protein